MSSTNASQNPVGGSRGEGRRPKEKVSVVRELLSAALPAAFGIFGFCLCLHWEADYHRKMDAIGRGEVKPEMLRVLKITSGGEDDTVSLGKFGTAVAWRSLGSNKDLSVGDKVAAYRFDDSYFIPCLDNRSFAGKWYFLIFSVGMGVVITVVRALRLRRWRRAAASPASTASARPATSAPPPAFSRMSLSFDRNPADSELTALLGEPKPGLVSHVEEAGVLIARPWVLPMKWIVIWLVIFTLGLTCWACVVLFLGHENKMNPSDVQSFCFYLSLMWLVGVPGMLAVLWRIRRSLAEKAKKGDYFKVDMSRRTLELCSAGRTFKAGEIVAFTVLSRRCRIVDLGNEWKSTLQTGVLVRAANNRLEHYPILHEWADAGLTAKRAKWADRLVGIFCVPVRRIELNHPESLALNDC
jgi:hypothetical protein